MQVLIAYLLSGCAMASQPALADLAVDQAQDQAQARAQAPVQINQAFRALDIYVKTA